MLGPTQIERLDAVIMFSWNIIVNVLVVGLIYIPVDLGDSYSQSNFSCATHVIKESPSHRPLPSSDLEKIELLPILEAEHTPELNNGAS